MGYHFFLQAAIFHNSMSFYTKLLIRLERNFLFTEKLLGKCHSSILYLKKSIVTQSEYSSVLHDIMGISSHYFEHKAKFAFTHEP